MTRIAVPVLRVEAPRAAAPVLLRRPVDIPPIPQRLPRHVALAPVRVVEQVLLREARVEAAGELEQRDVVVEEHAGGREDEEAAVEVARVRRRRPRVLVAEEVGVRGKHVGAWQGGLVVFGGFRVGERGLGQGGFVVEDAVERRGDEVVGVDEQNLAPLGHLKEAQLREDVCPAR